MASDDFSNEELFVGHRKSRPANGKLIFVFCGQGSQWCGMGRRLIETNAEFRRVLEACDGEFRRYGDWSLLEELARDASTTRIHQTAITQPSLFAVQVALAAAWKQLGIEPSLVVGHSVGEIAAAFVAGALSWRDACRVAFFRGRTMDRADSRGAMLAVGLSSSEIRRWLNGMNGHISIAAVNGPQSITLSGHAEHIETVETRLRSASVFCKRLSVEYAFHSSQMDPVHSDLLKALKEIRPTPSKCPIVSTVTGTAIDGNALDANYWWRNVRETVRFADAMTEAVRRSDADILEVGPHPALAYSIRECLLPGSDRQVFASLRRDEDGSRNFAMVASELFENGYDLRFPSPASHPRHKLHLPPHPFQRKSYWNESRERRLSRIAVESHPLLGEPTHGPNRHWGSRIDLKLQAYLSDHRVRGSVVYPAAAVIEAAVEASRRLSEGDSDAILLERLILHRPCLLSEDKPQWLECRHDPARRSLDFYFRDVDNADAWSHLATVGLASSSASRQRPTLDSAAVEIRCPESFDREAVYEYCERLGLAYGRRFQGIRNGSRGNRESLCRIDLQEGDPSVYTLHPSLLDACFHTMIAADDDFLTTVATLKLPAAIESIVCYRQLPSKLVVHTRIVERSKLRLLANLDVYTEEGECCVSIRGFESRAVSGISLGYDCDELMYRFRWEEVELPAITSTSARSTKRRWLVVGDDSAFRTSLLAAWDDEASIETVSLRDMAAAVADLARVEQTETGIIYLGALNCPRNDDSTGDSLWQSRTASCQSLIKIVQTWERVAPTHDCRLLIPTFNGQILDDEITLPEISQAPLIGLARVVSAEYARFKTKLIDLATGDSETDAARLIDELGTDDDEDEVLYRNGRRFVRRFDPILEQPASPKARDTLAYRLRRGRIPNIEALEYETESPIELGSEQVEIEVKAAGLNFSDVMKALDLYPGLTDDRPLLGAECAGTILRIGRQVAEWHVGDEVMAVAPGSLGNRVVCSASLIAKKPKGMSFEEAATVPIAFLTADYALENCGAMRTGDRVLIHAASGGVGQAAIQLAKSKGATIFATCGSDDKRSFVKAQGVSCVMNSRDLSFVGETLDATEGEGVDLVLNSLPGEALERGLTVLKPGGRFLEIGKRDIYADSPLGLFPMRNNLAFFAIDLDQLFKVQPKAMGERLRKLAARFESGELKPLPTRVFQADEAQAAFRWMQQSKHIGKIVVDYRKPASGIRSGGFAPIRFRRDGMYWIVGGLGGFGIELADWLASKGAGTIVLSSRRTEVSSSVEARLRKLREAGVNVVIEATDLSNPASVCKTLHRLQSTQPKLHGVFHTAMILEDRLLIDLDDATLDTVLAPKLLGGWHLHEALKSIELEHFVLFSSLTSIFGHAGQANYSAANAFLDSLAHYRQGLGLPAVVVNWGHLGGAGYIAQRQSLSERLERQGVLSFTAEEAFECLEAAMQRRECQVSVLRMDWSKWRGLGTSKVAPKFAHLLRNAHSSTAGGTQQATSASELRRLDLSARLPLITGMLTSKAASLLGISVGEMDTNRPFVELGLDSLMAVELRNWIESRFEASFPISAIMRSRGLQELSNQLAASMGDSAASTNARQSAELEPFAADHFPMSAGQKGLWYAYRRDPQSTAYNVFLPTRIRSVLDIEQLRQAIETVVRRHPSLRTTFSDDTWELTQTVHPELNPSFEVHDAGGLDDEEIRSRLLLETRRPFDLERGPLLRVIVYRHTEDDWIVMAMAHHIVVDFWSLVLILDELRIIYPALRDGDIPKLPSPTTEYAGFVARQLKQLSNFENGREQEFWQAKLRDTSSVLELPCDFARPAAFSGQADSVRLEFADGMLERVSGLASRLNVTNFAVLMSVLQVLLAKYSSQKRFLIGTPFAGRGHHEFERTVGFFVNMLLIKADIEANPTFETLVSQVGETLVEAMEHEDYPLASIVQDLSPVRDPSRSPLFQVSCTLERSQVRLGTGLAGFLFPESKQVGSLSGLIQESFHVPQTTCHYDIEFVLEESESGLKGMLIFCRDLFEADSMIAMSRSFGRLLEAFLDEPMTRVDEVAVDDFQFPKVVTVSHQPLDLFDEIVAEHPSRPALREGSKAWSYAELDEASRREVSSGLNSSAIDSSSTTLNRLQPIVQPRGAAAWMEILAAMRDERTPVPLDADTPSVNIAKPWPFLSQELSSIPDSELEDRSARIEDNSHYSVTRSEDNSLYSATQMEDNFRDTDAAYMIFTSGSTGRPNGVLVGKDGFANLLLWKREAMPLGIDDRVLLTLSHQFDAAWGVVFGAWTQGAEVVMPHQSNVADIDAIVDQIQRDAITVLCGFPGWLRLVVEHPAFPQCQSLRQIWSGGEVLPFDLASKILDTRRIRLWNLYGPTETTIEATAGEVTSGNSRRTIAIGKPVRNMTIMVFDEELRPVPHGACGELVVFGPGVAIGYWNRPELNAERFIEWTDSLGVTRRGYRTGDRGRRRADGSFEWLGRLDEQFKIRGFRIEPGEIEAAALSIPSVREAAAVVVDEPNREACLVLYVTLSRELSSIPLETEVAGYEKRIEDNSLYTGRRIGDNSSDTGAIRRYLAERLAAYKVPSRIVEVSRMPRNANGKIDRRSLASTPLVESPAEDFVEAANELEFCIAEIWKEVLGIERLGRDQNFFDLGGTSLQAARMTSILSERLGLRVPTAMVFDLADIAGIAHRLAQLHPHRINERFNLDPSRYDHEARSSAKHESGAATADDSAKHPLLVSLKSDGTSTPLFMIHPPGGFVVCYRELAKQMPVDFPLIGIRSRGLYGTEELPESLEAMAEEYAEAIRSHQQHGPYVLGGWSLGGIMAFETARCLERLGERVGAILLLDSAIPEANIDLSRRPELRAGAEYGLNMTLEELGRLDADEQLPFLWQHARNLGILGDDKHEELAKRVIHDLKTLFAYHVELCNRYRMEYFDGRVVLIRPREVPIGVSNLDDRGWRDFASEVEIRLVGGHHHSMVQSPNAGEIAAVVESILSGLLVG